VECRWQLCKPSGSKKKHCFIIDLPSPSISARALPQPNPIISHNSYYYPFRLLGRSLTAACNLSLQDGERSCLKTGVCFINTSLKEK
jgi:hypothetical protein